MVDAYAYAFDQPFQPTRKARSLLEWQALCDMKDIYGKHYPRYKLSRAEADAPDAWHGMVCMSVDYDAWYELISAL